MERKVSLIATLYNEANNVLKFLESYKRQIKHADEFIIVDGGSEDGTIEIVTKFSENNSYLNIDLIVDKACSKKHITGPIAKGRNIAIENTKCNYVAVTDAGCVLDKNWIKEIIKPFDDEGVDVVSGWYKTNVRSKFQKGYVRTIMPSLDGLNKEGFLPSSRSIAFKKRCWEAVNGYPDKTYTAEDTLFDLNMKKAGFKFKFTEKAFVYWDCPTSLEEAKEKHYNYGYGDGQLKLFFLKFLVRSPFNLKNIFSNEIKYEISKSYQYGYLKGLINAK